MLLTFAAVRLFQQSHRAAYDGRDVKVTYVLLCCTAALELVSAGTMVIRTKMSKPPWPDQVFQCNLIEYVARSEKHRRWRKMTSRLRCRQGFLDRFRYASVDSWAITELVHGYLAGGWTSYIVDVDTYRKFSDSRGWWTLRNESGAGGGDAVIKSSLRRPFDESLVLWHLATDFCFYDHVGIGSEAPRRCREMSNYMAHQLLASPETLMPGARSRIFDAVAYEEEQPEEDKPKEKKIALIKSKEDVARRIIQKLKSSKCPPGLVPDAWELAKALMDFRTEDGERDEEKMWGVVEAVWVEMLCFSAGRCRGYLHARSLGAGGEYLSYVWLLREYMGMETLAQRMQRAESEDEGDLGAAVPKSTQPSTVADEENVL